MVDVVSIIIAVISLAGTILTTALTAWFGYFSDERKRLRESEQLLSTYRDPLLLACQDLQSRLYNITEYTITDYFDEDDDKNNDKKDNLLLYTTYVVGQYLSWTYILRRKAQFLRFSIDEIDKTLTRVLAQIRFEFSTDKYSENSSPFMLWRGEQVAVGEVMTIENASELSCMGYAAFREKWAEDRLLRGGNESGRAFGKIKLSSEHLGHEEEDIWTGDFRPWFRPIIEGITEIAKAKAKAKAKIKDCNQTLKACGQKQDGQEHAVQLPTVNARIQLFTLRNNVRLLLRKVKPKRTTWSYILPFMVLTNYWFISVSMDATTFEMHALVQLAMRTWFEVHGKLERWKQQYAKNLCSEFPDGEHENWVKCEALFPDAKVAVSQQPKEEDSLLARWQEIAPESPTPPTNDEVLHATSFLKRKLTECRQLDNWFDLEFEGVYDEHIK